MVIFITSDEASTLARQLARETGESLTTAVTEALRERLDVVRQRKSKKAALGRIAQTARSRNVVDSRPHVEIVGYDDSGAPY